MKTLFPAVVRTCSRLAWVVVLVFAVGTALMAGYAADRLGMSTDTARLFPDDLPWRAREIEFDRVFPQNDDLLAVVIDADTPARADRAADLLAEEIRKRPDLFRNVYRPDGGDFFRRHGLLYLSVDELASLTAQVAEIQPFLGTLATDPSLAGLFEMLAQAMDGVRDGDIAEERVAEPLEAVAATVASVLDGRPRPLAWRKLVTGREPEPDELRRVLLVQPVLDFGALQPGAEPSAFIRESAKSLGLLPDQGTRVRLTGTVALEDEEFGTVAEGTGIAAVVSFLLVTLLLFLAVRSVRLVLCMAATLVAGMIATAAFAAAAVGTLNLISIAFVVLFIGIAVDFGIQFSVRYLAEREEGAEVQDALARAGMKTGPSLALAAAACAAGFLSLVPTEYRGMAEMGLISGFGMAVAFVFNLTLLPALITILRPGGTRSTVSARWAEPLDRLLIGQRRVVLLAAAIAALAGLASVPRLEFDYDPLHLKDPGTESVQTLYDLMGNPNATPFTINVLVRDFAEAKDLADRLKTLPEVDKVLTLDSFVPGEQDEKLALIDELLLLAGPMEVSGEASESPGSERTRLAMQAALERLETAPAGTRLADAAARLAPALRQALGQFPRHTAELQKALLADLPWELGTLSMSLETTGVTRDSLPPAIRESWIATDGRVRIEVFPEGDIRDNRVREEFAAAVRAVAPEATGAVIGTLESGRTIVRAFVLAGIYALLAIVVLLAVVLRRPGDVARVLAPLILGGLLTVLLCALCGLFLNFANIIALPLILGIGVSFAIYFVIAWRNGLATPLQSPIARAVLFSALTTGVAFGSLMLSTHPGTASMGLLLSIALGCTLFTTLFVLPAVLGPPPEPGHGNH